jgi:hypothetical protein
VGESVGIEMFGSGVAASTFRQVLQAEGLQVAVWQRLSTDPGAEGHARYTFEVVGEPAAVWGGLRVAIQRVRELSPRAEIWLVRDDDRAGRTWP